MWKGRKIILRRLTATDAETVQKWYVDREFRMAYNEYTSVELDSIREEIKKADQEISDPRTTKVVYMVVRKADKQPIGLACLRKIDRQNGNAEVVLGIGEKDMRLAGYGVDMLIVLLDILFYELGLEKSYLRIYDNHDLGLNSALNFGFVIEGRMRKQAFLEGKYVDVLILGLLKNEYEALSIVPKWKSKYSQNE